MENKIPKQMRAGVYRGVDDLRLETLPVPEIGAEELLVRVAVCGVCPTDLKKIHYGTVPPPRIFGHETSGTVAQVGERLEGFAWEIGWACIITCRVWIVIFVGTRLSRSARVIGGR